MMYRFPVDYICVCIRCKLAFLVLQIGLKSGFSKVLDHKDGADSQENHFIKPLKSTLKGKI